MKILITGGTTFASRYVAEHFVSKGDEVFVLNRNSRPQSQGVRLINCDRLNLGNKFAGAITELTNSMQKNTYLILSKMRIFFVRRIFTVCMKICTEKHFRLIVLF